MSRSRWFRVVICLLLVSCLLFNMSPIRAQALAIEASLAIGLVATMIAATAGIVFVTESDEQIKAIGNSFQTYMYQWGTSAEKLDEVETFLTLYRGINSGLGGDDDEGDAPTDTKVKLARGILAGISAWCASILAGNITPEEEVATAPDGYMYYGNELHPALPEYDISAYSYAFIGNKYTSSTGKSEFHLWLSSAPLTVQTVSTSTNKVRLNSPTSDGISVIHYMEQSGTWTYIENEWDYLTEMYGRIWSSYDLCRGSTVVYPATQPSPVKTEPILPNTYVGDIPEQVQNGTIAPDAIELPDIDYGALMAEGQPLQDAVTSTMLQLSTGALSYEDFMDKIYVEPSAEPEPDPEPVPDPTLDIPGNDDPEDQPEEWKPPTDPNAFALDLSQFFPFCIPFDLYDFFSCLNADPVAPVIEWQIPLPGGSAYPITIDLSVFDPVARILRIMELLAFCVGLAFKTRDLIRG